MKLMAEAIEATIPPLYSTEAVNAQDKVLVAKFFLPGTRWTWYVTEGQRQAAPECANCQGDLGLSRFIDLPCPDCGETMDSRRQMTDMIFFGYVVSGMDPDYDEWGYFSLNELSTLVAPFGLQVERDLYFEPQTFGDRKSGVMQ